MAKPTIFISYSSEDGEKVKNLVAFVRTLDVELRYDEDFLRPSNPIGEKLREEILSSHGCLWVLTENSVKSEWCPVEVGAFWGAGKPLIIYNVDGMNYKGPFSGLRHARNYDEIKLTVEGLETRGSTLGTVTVEEASKLIEKSVNSAVEGLSEEIAQFREHLPAVRHMTEVLELQNAYLPDHAAVLKKITEMIAREPKKLTCAFDVPSFGSVSAEAQYRICCDAFDKYTTNEEWNLTILLLPADVGIKIVNNEYPELKRQKHAWVEDIKALRRFQWYAQHAEERGQREFRIGWLAVNRDANDAPLGVHSMPLNVWVSDNDEAVFSTVINNYHPTRDIQTAGSHPKEIGFSTRNRDMVRFLSEITEKYAQNIDEAKTLDSQIAASEEAKSRIDKMLEGATK